MFLPGAALFLLSNEETAPRELFLDIPKDMKSFHTLELTENGSYHLPSDYHIGLVFIGLGNYETHSTQANPVNLRHLWAEKPDFDLDEVSAANSAAVDYLSNVLGVEQDLSLDVFWFGRKGIFKTVGGSAGYKSVCVNYFKKRSILLDKVPMIILLHEQFHLLNADGPLWMQESLAQYYAMKSHHKSGILNDESFKKIVDKMTDSQAVDLGLVDIQREFEQTGNPFYYHQFYSRGVRFWLEVDQAIKTYTDGIKSLDDVVLRLLKLDFGTYGEAPSSFQDILMTVGGSKCVDLYNAYIAINSR